MEKILEAIIGYLVSYAIDGTRSKFESQLQTELANREALAKSIAAARPLREELRTACIKLAQHRDRVGVSKQEEPLWRLLSNESFQSDLIEWFMAGGIAEGEAVKARLLQTMEAALSSGGASPERITALKTGYFDALEKAVFSHPALAHWRHQLSLDYLREQVGELRKRAEEAAGIYTPEKQQAALDRYCEKELAAWDIIDLSNLPEGDVQIATQQLLLRQLYMPLRIEGEAGKKDKEDGSMLDRLEELRDTRRRREAGRMSSEDADERVESRAPVGERLGASRRLVVLGDPGGGKTTLLRWMATAYLMKHKGDPAYTQIPDTATLPDRTLIPVLIRCRDLHESHLGSCFADFLCQHLHKTALQPEEARIMNAVILDRIAKGEILLLIDGLDEITHPKVRVMFCQELERTSVRYPGAHIVVTSRIVGYRDMPYRMGSGFEHGVIAELSSEDKDLFAQRWVAVTEQHQTDAEKTKRAQELLEALHSSDRIERLTGNPMLLTTLALVKRKVGKLPNRRNKLYAEAVSVLLNWNPRLYQTIEETEAIPQLEYLAYEMCRRGVQRLSNDEVLDLLDKLRVEYPNIRAIRNRQPLEFLTQLEARSSILIKSGGVWQESKTRDHAVWEFRHLTFQEYLAARALLDGRYPDRDKSKSLAEQVAPLAGAVEQIARPELGTHAEEEMEVPESWREALRLLVADCKDDDVDEVLLSILNPLPGEDAATTGRPRAALAALCLADEPNVSEKCAEKVLTAFITKVEKRDGFGYVSTYMDRAAMEVGNSIWAPLLKKLLIQAFCERPDKARANVGGLLAMLETVDWAKFEKDESTVIASLLTRLHSKDQHERISAALTVMEAAFEQKAMLTLGLIDALMQTLGKGTAERQAGAWALLWLNGGFSRRDNRKIYWQPAKNELTQIIRHLEKTEGNEGDTQRFLGHILENTASDSGEVTAEMLLPYLNSASAEVRKIIANLLGKLSHQQAVPPLLDKLDNESNIGVRHAVIAALGMLGDKQVVSPLLNKLGEEHNVDIRQTIVTALGNLGDKQAVAPLLAKLENSSDAERIAIINALAKLGDTQAINHLLPLLEGDNDKIFSVTALALVALGYDQAASVLAEYLELDSPAKRKAAVRALVELRGNPNENKLLSNDFDGLTPWLDPAIPVTEARIIEASENLKISTKEARALYEAIAPDFHLKFA